MNDNEGRLTADDVLDVKQAINLLTDDLGGRAFTQSKRASTFATTAMTLCCLAIFATLGGLVAHVSFKTLLIVDAVALGLTVVATAGALWVHVLALKTLFTVRRYAKALSVSERVVASGVKSLVASGQILVMFTVLVGIIDGVVLLFARAEAPTPIMWMLTVITLLFTSPVINIEARIRASVETNILEVRRVVRLGQLKVGQR